MTGDHNKINLAQARPLAVYNRCLEFGGRVLEKLRGKGGLPQRSKIDNGLQFCGNALDS